MASEKEILAVFDQIQAEIPGFIAISLVDLDSGMTLAVKSARQEFDLTAASAFNSEVVKQKFKVIKALNLGSMLEEILMTLSDQIHMIRLVNGGTSFIYLAADRSAANLAIVRSAVIRHVAAIS